MSDAHRLVAEVALALALLAATWALGLAATGRSPGRFFAVNLAWAGIAIVATAVLGLFLFATGSALGDPLHLVYGALAMAAIPVAAAVVTRRPASQQTTVLVIATIVLLILLLRLFQTG